LSSSSLVGGFVTTSSGEFVVAFTVVVVEVFVVTVFVFVVTVVTVDVLVVDVISVVTDVVVLVTVVGFRVVVVVVQIAHLPQTPGQKMFAIAATPQLGSVAVLGQVW